jgi:hypothetical protein
LRRTAANPVHPVMAGESRRRYRVKVFIELDEIARYGSSWNFFVPP